ncbi:hypothetical protein ACFS07_32165 [Undibacterium arcticum]
MALAATYFSLLRQRKSKQKERRPRRLALRVPVCAPQKWEMSETRLRLKQRTFLIHFLRRANGSVSSGFYGKVKSKFKKTRSTTDSTTRTTSYWSPRIREKNAEAPPQRQRRRLRGSPQKNEM